MTTATQAFAALRGVIDAAPPCTVRWQNEDADSDGNTDIADTPARFAYVMFDPEPGFLAEFGGGRLSNRYRNPYALDIYVFSPRGEGLAVSLTLAEQFATLFRSFRDADVSCLDASVRPGGRGTGISPPGEDSAVGNYFWSKVEVSGHYDQIG